MSCHFPPRHHRVTPPAPVHRFPPFPSPSPSPPPPFSRTFSSSSSRWCCRLFLLLVSPPPSRRRRVVSSSSSSSSSRLTASSSSLSYRLPPPLPHRLVISSRLLHLLRVVFPPVVSPRLVAMVSGSGQTSTSRCARREFPGVSIHSLCGWRWGWLAWLLFALRLSAVLSIHPWWVWVSRPRVPPPCRVESLSPLSSPSCRFWMLSASSKSVVVVSLWFTAQIQAAHIPLERGGAAAAAAWLLRESLEPTSLNRGEGLVPAVVACRLGVRVVANAKGGGGRMRENGRKSTCDGVDG